MAQRTILIAIFVLSALKLVTDATVVIANQAFKVDGRVFTYVLDDVMITLRVAANIAGGHGPYFNVGEQVAANTSLLWPYLLSVPAYFLPPHQLVWAAGLSTIGFATATLALLVFAARRPAAALYCALAFVLSPSVVLYTPSGWEHVPEAFFVALGAALLLNRFGARLLGISSFELGLLSFCIAFLIRPDALLFLLLPGAVLTWRVLRNRDFAPLRTLSVVGIMVLAYYGFHYLLYGDFVPNTYYLKASADAISASRGIKYILSNVTSSGISIFVISCVFFVVVQWKRLPLEILILTGSLILYMAYVIYIGGDYFPHGRFLLCVLPMSLILLVAIWEHSRLAMPRLASVGVAGLIGAILLQLVAHTIEDTNVAKFSSASGGRLRLDSSRSTEHDLMRSQLLIASVLRDRLKPTDGPIAVFLAGALPYYLPEYTIADFLGKADASVAHSPAQWGPIAHNKWNLNITLDIRKPAVIVLKPLSLSVAERSVREHDDFGALGVLMLDPRFQDRFIIISPDELGIPGEWGIAIRKDLISRFAGIKGGG